MYFGHSPAHESSRDRPRHPQPPGAAVTTENEKATERALPALMMPVGMMLEFFPCAAALWSADRRECVFNSATRSLLGYSENSFCAEHGLWLERIEVRDRNAFFSAWESLQQGERKISCYYRFTPKDSTRRIFLQETAVLLPVGSAGPPAVLSLYQTKPLGTRARTGERDDAAARMLIHHMGNNLQAIGGELDLLHLTGVLPRQSFDNITQGIEQLHELIVEVVGLSDLAGLMPASSRARRSARSGVEKIS